MTSPYWPWWLGALALAGVNLSFWWFLGRSLGVSGHWRMATQFLENRRLDEIEKPFFHDPQALQAALEQATREQFGHQGLGAMAVAQEGIDTPAPSAPVAVPDRVPWSAHVVFLVMILVGGYLAQALRGPGTMETGMYSWFREIVGTGWGAISLLGLSGFCVGFGARMAGGCTAWHGLTGCSRLQWPSMLATGSFIGGAVAVSFFFAWLKL